jgi:hypothetical protein
MTEYRASYLAMAYRKRLPTAHTCTHCHEG